MSQLRFSALLLLRCCETFSWVRTCKSATTVLFIFEFRLCSSVIKKLWKCAVKQYSTKSERKRRHQNMQCPSPYWSTPLTPEDRRINSKKKTFTILRFCKLFAGNFFCERKYFSWNCRFWMFFISSVLSRSILQFDGNWEVLENFSGENNSGFIEIKTKANIGIWRENTFLKAESLDGTRLQFDGKKLVSFMLLSIWQEFFFFGKLLFCNEIIISVKIAIWREIHTFESNRSFF